MSDAQPSENNIESVSNIPSPSTTKEVSISRILSNVQPSIRDFLAPIINIGRDGKFYEPTCEFCAHQYREDAEIYYNSLEKIDPKRIHKVENYLLVEKGSPLNIDCIRNHIENHMDRGDAELRKVEYINKLSNLASVDMNTFQRIKMALAAITERLTAMHSCPTSGKLENEEKKSKSINDLIKTWTNLVELQSELMGEMIGKGEVITIHKEDFNRVMGNAMQNAKTDGEKKLILSLLSDFETCGLNKA